MMRSLYRSCGYVTAARQLELGIIERRGKKTVVWLSEEERTRVCELTRHKWYARHRYGRAMEDL